MIIYRAFSFYVSFLQDSFQARLYTGLLALTIEIVCFFSCVRHSYCLNIFARRCCTLPILLPKEGIGDRIIFSVMFARCGLVSNTYIFIANLQAQQPFFFHQIPQMNALRASKNFHVYMSRSSIISNQHLSLHSTSIFNSNTLLYLDMIIIIIYVCRYIY